MGTDTQSIRLYTEVQSLHILNQNANGLSRKSWPGDDPARTPVTVELVPYDKAKATGLTQEVMSTGGGPKQEGRAPNLGGGDVEGSS